MRIARVLVVSTLVAASPLPLQAQPGAQSYTIEHFAGSVGGAGALDLTGASARFNSPWGLARDSAGNLYVADTRSATIRVVTPGGEVRTLAGTAFEVGATAGRRHLARLSNPRHMTIDAAGHLYVADATAYVIWKITNVGVVTVFAGTASTPGSANGTGTAASFNFPSAITYDASSGNFYVADTGNHTIRKITAAGVVTTYAGLAGTSGSDNGTGEAARFSSPEGVATDAAGIVYVADTNNRTIRKITTDRAVTTFAGTAGMSGAGDDTGPAASFSYPSGIAVDGSNNLWVTDGLRVRKITPGAVVTTHAGGSRGDHFDGNRSVAGFGMMRGITVDSEGNIYVADMGSEAIRRIGSDDNVTTIAGKGVAQAHLDDSGEEARFNNPMGVAIDSSGFIFIAEQGSHTIRKVDPATREVTTFAGTVNSAGYENTVPGPAAARFYWPSGLSIDSANNLYVADYGGHTIRKVSSLGIVSTIAGTGGMQGTTNANGADARFKFPLGTAVDASGNVYVAEYGNHAIRKITPSGDVTTFAGSLTGASGAVNGTGNDARFHYPYGVAVDSSGNVFVADFYNHAIRKITPDRVVSTFAGELGQAGMLDGAGTAARLLYPISIAIDSANNLYVGEQQAGTLRKITSDGAVTTIGGKALHVAHEDGTGQFARLGYVNGIGVTTAGDIYLTDSFWSVLRRARPAFNSAATIDSANGLPGATRQLSTTIAGTSYQWDLIRRPWVSSATLSSTTTRSPTFTPDRPDLYVFRLTTSNGLTNSITQVELTVDCAVINVLPVNLPHPVNGSAYSRTIGANGGAGGYTFTVVSGSLPPGLTLATSGTLSGAPTTNGAYTFTVRVTDNIGCTGQRQYSLTVAPIAAVAAMFATGSTSPSPSVSIDWSVVSGAAGYRVYRRRHDEPGYTAIGTSTTNAYTDGTVALSAVYAYRVRAYTASMIETGDSPTDFAHTVVEVPVATGGLIYAAIVEQMRTILDRQRGLAGMTAPAYTDPSLTGVRIKAIHVQELRDRWNAMRAHMGQFGLVFTDPALAGLAVKALHVTELRLEFR